MGQDNEKVKFEGHLDNNNSHRKRIFNVENRKGIKEICEVPGCRCNLEHHEVHAKVCESCLESPPPFMKSKARPKYYTQNYSPQSASPSAFLQKSYRQDNYAQALPNRISYYNAWSLPSQKYQIKERNRFQYDDRSSDQSNIRYPPSDNGNNIKPIIAIIDPIVPYIPKPYMGHRKQNLNLVE